MKQLRLNQTQYKVLLTIKLLNDSKYYPLNEGVYKLLMGLVDYETEMFSSLKTFGTLISISKRKVSSIILSLIKLDYLGKIFEVKSDQLYLRITQLGLDALQNFERRRKVNFKNKKTCLGQTIVKIDD